MGAAGPIVDNLGAHKTLNILAGVVLLAILLPFSVREVREIKAN
jgi:hypothetical protein